MVLNKTVDNLKGKPDEEKKVVAGGIAIAVVIVLFFGWAFLFFKKVQRGTAPDFQNIVPEEFRSASVRSAEQQLLEDTTQFDELRTVREQAAEQYQPAEQENYQQSEIDAFGQPNRTD